MFKIGLKSRFCKFPDTAIMHQNTRKRFWYTYEFANLSFEISTVILNFNINNANISLDFVSEILETTVEQVVENLPFLFQQ